MKSLSTDQIAVFAADAGRDSARWKAWEREHTDVEIEVVGKASDGASIVGLGPEYCVGLVPQNHPPLHGAGAGIVVVFFLPSEVFLASSIDKGMLISARGKFVFREPRQVSLEFRAINCHHLPAA